MISYSPNASGDRTGGGAGRARIAAVSVMNSPPQEWPARVPARKSTARCARRLYVDHRGVLHAMVGSRSRPNGASRRSLREVMPSLVKTFFKCHSTVRGLRYS